MTSSSDTLLRVENLSCSFTKDHPIFSNVNVTVNKGDVIAVVGKSGGGKSTFLKCISHLTASEGSVYLYGKKPTEYGVPEYRTRVLYVPQRQSLLPGTPREFLKHIHKYSSRKSETDNEADAINLAESWSLPEDTFDRPWSSLSGGESQRAALAIACTLKTTEVLLLDEPTSALDATSAHAVENYLVSQAQSSKTSLQAIIWVTHSDEQTKKGNRLLRCDKGMREESIPASV